MLMSHIIRYKSLPDITPIIKAYPPKQSKEDPYQPMHPNLKNEFEGELKKIPVGQEYANALE